MACSIRGLDLGETRDLTQAMLESGEQWDLAADLPTVGDKHSTGGVGDKVSLLLAPLMAAVDRPVMMLAGRGLGHTGGTTDKLEAIPGVELSLDRQRCLETLKKTGMAIGQATGGIAPADKRLYALRDRCATIDVIPLICGSILSKKLAVGAAAIVFDVKTGDGAFMQKREDSVELARQLVDTTRAMGRKASALVTDMSQPLGRWVGHTAEVREMYECFDGHGQPDFLEVTFLLCEELSDDDRRPPAQVGVRRSDAQRQSQGTFREVGRPPRRRPRLAGQAEASSWRPKKCRSRPSAPESSPPPKTATSASC